MLTRLTNSQKKTLFCSIWAIWSDQNKALHEGLHQTVLKTVQFIQKYLGEWERDNSILLGQRIEEERWRPSKGNTAIQWGIERGFRQVEIEGDALSIIKKFQNNEEDKSVLRAYILDIKELSKSFEDCRFKKNPMEKVWEHSVEREASRTKTGRKVMAIIKESLGEWFCDPLFSMQKKRLGLLTKLGIGDIEKGTGSFRKAFILFLGLIL
ncbi:hypothetical protein Goklo_022526, partial [Gossypium klotzschianum]|nr:hypothetical protein [Gossypium klotzschianum]